MQIHDLNTKALTDPAYVAFDDGTDTYKTEFNEVVANAAASAVADADLTDNTVAFTSGDAASPTSWTAVSVLTSGLTIKVLFNRISTMIKNVRWLYSKLGTTDISSIGGGTVTGAISSLNSKILSGTISANGQLSFTLTIFAVFIGFYSSGQNAIFGFRNGAAAEIVKNGSALTATVTGNNVTISNTSSGGIRYFLLDN